MNELDAFTRRALDALSPPALQAPDWADVLSRAAENGYRADAALRIPRRLQGRRRLALTIAAVLVIAAILLATPALGLRSKLVSIFSDAEPAPVRIVKEFQSFGLGHLQGGHNVKFRQARRITEVPLGDGRKAVLYAAPQKGGGYCTTVETQRSGKKPGPRSGSCVHPDPSQPLLIGVSMGASSSDGSVLRGPVIVDGSVFLPDAAAIEIQYQDGTSSRAPVIWVSEPIGAGLFVAPILGQHWQRGHLPTTMVVLDSEGHELTRDESSLRSSFSPTANRSCMLGQRLVPCDAILSKRRELVSITMQNGVGAAIWVAPSADGAVCFWQTTGDRGGGGGFGCTPADNPVPRNALYAGVQSSMGKGRDRFSLYWGQVGDNIAAVELRFQNGDRQLVQAVEGFVLTEILPKHYARGHRLEEVVGLDTVGQAASRKSVATRTAGIYPCDQEIVLGTLVDGEKVTACP